MNCEYVSNTLRKKCYRYHSFQNPWNGIIPQSILGDCFALLPKAGGGGKEGVLHKEAWDSLALKSVNTLEHLAEQIFSVLPAMKNKSRTTETPILDLPR